MEGEANEPGRYPRTVIALLHAVCLGKVVHFAVRKIQPYISLPLFLIIVWVALASFLTSLVSGILICKVMIAKKTQEGLHVPGTVLSVSPT